MPDIETSLARATALPGCTVLGDYADNPGGGAAGDSTYFLRALLLRDAQDAAIGCFWDPMVASLCEQAGVGARLPVRLGGKCGPASGEPIDAQPGLVRRAALAGAIGVASREARNRLHRHCGDLDPRADL